MDGDSLMLVSGSWPSLGTGTQLVPPLQLGPTRSLFSDMEREDLATYVREEEGVMAVVFWLRWLDTYLASDWTLFTNSNLPGLFRLLWLDGKFFFIRSIEGEDDRATVAQAVYYAWLLSSDGQEEHRASTLTTQNQQYSTLGTQVDNKRRQYCSTERRLWCGEEGEWLG